MILEGPCEVVGSPHGNGYRTLRVDGRNVYAHRYRWEQEHGPIPDELTLDHLCRNRECSNPKHLEPTTNAENILRGESPPATNARKESCPQCGGPYTVQADGTRRCMACRRRGRIARGDGSGRGHQSTWTHCARGHEYTEANTIVIRRADGSVKQRQCRECRRQWLRDWRAAKKEVVP